MSSTALKPSRRPPPSVSPLVLPYHLLRDIVPPSLILASGALLQIFFTHFRPTQVPVWVLVGGLIVVAFSGTAKAVLRGEVIRTGGAKKGGKKVMVKTFAQLSEGEDGPKEMAVLLIGARCNSWMGALDPRSITIAKQFMSLIRDLKKDPDSGFLGMEDVIKVSSFSHNRLQQQIYFRSMNDIQRFAHAEHHRQIWSDFYKLDKSDDIELWHEAYSVSAGQADAVYFNAPIPHGLGSCFELEEETGEWKSLHREASGRNSTSKGRLAGSKGDLDERKEVA